MESKITKGIWERRGDNSVFLKGTFISIGQAHRQKPLLPITNTADEEKDANLELWVLAGNLAQTHPDHQNWQAKLDTFDKMVRALEMISTGSIAGHENSHKDTCAVMREIASECLKKVI